MDAKTATLAYRRGEISRGQMTLACFPLIRRLCRAVAHKLFYVDADDLAQEVWLAFERKLIDSFDPTFPIEPILLEYARRIGMSLRTGRSEIALSDLSERENEQLEAIGSAGVAYLDEDELDRKRALDLIGNRLYHSTPLDKRNSEYKQTEEYMQTPGPRNSVAARSVDHRGVTPATPVHAMAGLKLTEKKHGPHQMPQPARRALPLENRLGSDHKELVRIRKCLRWTQRRMADELLILQPRLASYEYGRTDSVPEYIMARAYALEKEEGGLAANNLSRFEGRPMAEILKDWCDRMGVDYSDNRSVSAALSASVPTIVRWKNGITRPSIQGLIAYEGRVIKYSSDRVVAKDRK